MIRQLFPLTRPFLLLFILALATSANGQNSFNARITITSQCDTQQALFGPQAQHNVTVICQPGTTPYKTKLYSVDNVETDADDDQTAGDAQEQQDHGDDNSVAFNPSSQKIVSQPLLNAATFVSKVVFIVF